MMPWTDTNIAFALSNLTKHYAELWRECWDDEFLADGWASDSPILRQGHFQQLGPEWKWEYPSRSHFERRQLLVELDVLVAMDLGFTLEELILIYRVQFPTLKAYERETFYDQEGDIVFTASKGLAGVGVPRRPRKGDSPCVLRYADGTTEERIIGWKDVKEMKAGDQIERTVVDNTQPGGPVERVEVYHAPFFSCSRAEDYKSVWSIFEERFAKEDLSKVAPLPSSDEVLADP